MIWLLFCVITDLLFCLLFCAVHTVTMRLSVCRVYLFRRCCWTLPGYRCWRWAPGYQWQVVAGPDALRRLECYKDCVWGPHPVSHSKTAHFCMTSEESCAVCNTVPSWPSCTFERLFTFLYLFFTTSPWRNVFVHGFCSEDSAVSKGEVFSTSICAISVAKQVLICTV